MQAKDIMTKTVVTVKADALIDDIATLMVDNHISALPVVDNAGAVIGLVSEGDLMRRVEGASDASRSWWLSLFSGATSEAQDFVALRGRHVRDIMTRDVLTVGPNMPIGEIAVLLEKNRIKRVPVVDGGKLVGIVSRANLLQGLASVPVTSPGPNADDRALRDAILEALQSVPKLNLTNINVTVQDRDAKIWGIADTAAEEEAVRVAAENVDGLRSVDVHLGRVPAWAWGI